MGILAAWGRSELVPFFYIITYFYIKIKRAIALINYGKHMVVGPIARSETKISYGRADREFRCSRADRDRLDMIEAYGVEFREKIAKMKNLLEVSTKLHMGVPIGKTGLACRRRPVNYSTLGRTCQVLFCTKKRTPKGSIQTCSACISHPSHHR